MASTPRRLSVCSGVVHDTAIIVKFFQTTSREREPALLIGGSSSIIQKGDAARRISMTTACGILPRSTGTDFASKLAVLDVCVGGLRDDETECNGKSSQQA
jgi:hypothetical protein